MSRSFVGITPWGAVALVFTACAPQQIGSDGGSVVDAAVVEDAGGRDGDAGQPDAGSTPVDAGSDAGVTDASVVDAGPSCEAEDPCAGVPVTSSIQLVSGPVPALVVNGTTLSLGTATRGDVEAALGGAGLTSGENAYRAYHCAHGVTLYYVDDVAANGKFEGAASAGDILARVVTLPGAQATATNGVVLGGARETERARLNGPTSYDVGAGGYDVAPGDGMALVSNTSGEVTSLTLFKPQTADRWGLAIDIPAARIGVGGAAVGRGDSFSDADAALGTAWDQQGMVDVGNIDAQVRLYSSFGVRLAGGCLFGDCALTSVVLSPPFLGASADGIRLGASQAEVEAVYGAGVPSAESPNLLVYETGGRDLGVVYVEDAACVWRVAGLVLGYTEAP